MGLVVALALACPRRALAYDFTFSLRTVGQGYQVRRFASNGSNQLLNRRRYTQYLELSVFDLTAPETRGPGGDRNLVFVDVSLRFDSDFGTYMLNRPRGDDSIRELRQAELAVMWATVSARGLKDRFDLDLGRQLHMDAVDFFAFDGARVAARLPAGLRLEGYAGTEVRGELPLSAPIYEEDGTSAGSRDPRTRPAQSEALRPLFGGAVELLRAHGGARLGYRRSLSATERPLPGEARTATNHEAATALAHAFVGPVGAAVGVRYNLLLAGVDDSQASLRVRLTPHHVVWGEHAYLAPSFDGDSIWNVFATGPYRDWRVGWDATPRPGLDLGLRGFLRTFLGVPSAEAGLLAPGVSPPGGDRAAGLSAGVRLKRPRSSTRADLWFDDGMGGRRLGLDLSGRYVLRRPRAPRATEVRFGGGWDLEGRLTASQTRPDLATSTRSGSTMGLQAGTRYHIADGMRLHVLVEDNVGTFFSAQWRGLAILDLDVWL